MLRVSAAAALLGATVASAGGPVPVLRLQDPALVESSGLAASTLHDDVLWTHADGGTVAQVRAVDASGATVATVTLDGIDPYDPEALAPGGDELFLGDIGDNRAQRPHVSVFRFAEPRSLHDRTVDATWYRFTYPDGPHDAEALLVHPDTGRLLIATKDVVGGGLYRAPRDLASVGAGVNRLERVADVPPFVTDGAYLPDGRFTLRTYSSVHVYDRPGHQVGTAPLPAQPQGESLAVRGDRLLVGSEGERSAVFAVDVPGPSPESSRAPAAGGPGGPSGPSGPGRSAAVDAGGWRDAYLVARAGAVLVLLLGVVLVLRRSRRR